MFDVITIGSAVVDIFVHSSEFTLHKSEHGMQLCQTVGDKVELDQFVMHTGGGATNTAVGFQRLGLRAAVVAEMGRDTFAEAIVADLHREQVGTSLLVREKKEHTGGSVILVGTDGGRTALVHRGAAAQLDVADIPVEALAAARWLHLSSIGGYPDVLQKIFATARDTSTGVSWNPGKKELAVLAEGKLAELNLWCQILIVNKEEWASIAPIQKQLLTAVERIVITDGSRGGEVIIKGNPFSYTAQQVESVDDTGAGDAFASGFVAAHLHELPDQQAIEWGIHNAAAVVQQVGAKPGLLTRELLASFV